jgi:ribosome biogenesis GTPase
VGESIQATGAVREADSRGRHTTTARQLHLLPGGACLIDTPGLRGLRLDLDESQLDDAFADISALAPHCRFRDCRHEHEPGCAVRAAVAPDRLANYHKLRREIARETAGPLERERARSRAKSLERAVRDVLNRKRPRQD